MHKTRYEEILEFWFGTLDELGRADDEHFTRWWKKDEEFDRLVRDRFSPDHQALMAGACDDWLAMPRGRLAFIIVLDQFSRNMFRGTPAMFASDDRALALASGGIAQGADRELRGDERAFFYMPFMHSDDPAAQERCVDLFARFRDEQSDSAMRERIEHSLKFAIRHRDIVKRFGRFPHRNAILGRESTPEECAFLEQPGSSF